MNNKAIRERRRKKRWRAVAETLERFINKIFL